MDPQDSSAGRGRLVRTVSGKREFGTKDSVDEVSDIDRIRALEHEMFGEAQSTPLLISVRVRVGDIPEEETVDVDPSADVVETLRRELGIDGAACPPRLLASPDE